MDTFPRVSVVCSTYGRWWLLEEMLASFLAQDYPGELELVVVNDAPCRLSFDESKLPANRYVVFCNLSQEATSNPWKRDLGVSLATGEWCTYYDDDDIMLPHRFSRQVGTVISAGCDYLATHVAAVWQDGKYVELAENFFFCSHLWKRSMLSPIPTALFNEWDDVSAAARLRSAGVTEHRIDRANMEPGDVVHIYRWGGGEAHHSGGGGKMTARQKEIGFKDMVRHSPNWRTGDMVLNPHLNHAYSSLWQQYNKRANP